MSALWPTIEATLPCPAPPTWAVLQRRLFTVLDRAWRAFADRYTEGDGRLVFRGRLGVPPDDRDGVDDFYEPFFNWPLLYLLGGDDDLLAAAKRHWRGVTAQLTELGMVRDGHERGYDWFHQGEGLLFFYHLCLADPHDESLRAQAVRSAELYLGGPPGNYDPAHNVIVAPHNGADGPRAGLTGGTPVFPWSPVFVYYGLPLDWIPGITSYEQLLADPALAGRMGQEMRERMGRGDTAVNLAATSLLTNAYLLTGRAEFRDWVLRYTGGWLARMRAGGGVLPDNVGLGGTVGEYLGGRWYGGHYGWAWPHGLHSVGAAAVVAACNAALLGGDETMLDLGRGPLDQVLAHARTDGGTGATLVPYKHNDSGWHTYKPMQMALPVALWQFSQDPGDTDRLTRLGYPSGPGWRDTQPVRGKEEAGHEQPWLAYLAGSNPAYPEQALHLALAVVAHRLARIRADPTDPHTGPGADDLHHWQDLNPVVTEALSQLTCGAPQPLYNGGLWHARLRYHDPERGRPGLPPDVAALVDRIGPDRVSVQLVNLDPVRSRRVVVQAGAFAEHSFGTVTFDQAADAWPPSGPNVPLQPRRRPGALTVDGAYVQVHLPPATSIRLDSSIRLRAHPPAQLTHLH
ncbi:hypothetical protein [Rugosimonospora africana]|uniref:Uncharacterized protein n=1 Tax=Rugosimonospora africana TaxID=556532 RepID=A0A8J3R181_9ACTN|nr:hypothetical protein [Rugosimonospora africana]GIH19505.1 hypothetical protein Raf01_76770 [Rugosimonospora africana]